MHALKVSWGGQTFALAKCNDSQGRKSRIRRTKEERKTMVESFINAYRTSNNGKFPSLNLTHKEVGGSFYTVREIVRDIIQENKVLGPAMGFSEQYVSDSLSVEPDSHLSISEIGRAIDHAQKEILSITNDVQSMSEDIPLSKGQSISRCYEMVESEGREINIPLFIHEEATNQRQNVYDGTYMNGGLLSEECKEEDLVELSEPGKIRAQKDETWHSEVHATEKLGNGLDKHKGSTEMSEDSTTDGGMVSKTMDLDIMSEAKVVMKVETSSKSPLIQVHPTPTTSNCSLIEESEAQVMTGMLQLQDTNPSTEKVELPSDLPTLDTIPKGEMASYAVKERTETEIVDFFPAHKSTPTDDSFTPKISYLSNGTGLESSISHDDELNVKTYQKHLATGAELEQQSVPNDSQIGEAVSDATIDRVRGESFSSATDQISRSSEKAAEEPAVAREINPIWVAFKAFLTAFVKFWVE